MFPAGPRIVFPQVCHARDLPGPARARLSAALPDRDPAVRAAAARALGRTRDPAALAPLVAAFERWLEPDVAAALGDLGQPGAAVPLATALVGRRAGSDPALAAAAVVAISRVGGRRELDAVAFALDHPAPDVRARAVAAARALGGTRARGLVEERRRDFALVVREAVDRAVSSWQ